MTLNFTKFSTPVALARWGFATDPDLGLIIPPDSFWGRWKPLEKDWRSGEGRYCNWEGMG